MKRLEKEYNDALELFGVNCGLWDSVHLNFSPYYFCEANRKGIIAEYLYWEHFTELLKKHNFVYYWGIDKFLKEYKKRFIAVSNSNNFYLCYRGFNIGQIQLWHIQIDFTS